MRGRWKSRQRIARCARSRARRGRGDEQVPSFFRSLFGQVVAALILGVILGVAVPDFATALKPLGDGFIKLIKMVIAPLVFCVVVLGISGTGDLKKVGRVGVKAVIYFEVLTTFALIIGVILAYVFKPGVGMDIDPATMVDAFAKGDILQVLLIAILFGAAIAVLGERGRPVFVAIEHVSHVLFE